MYRVLYGDGSILFGVWMNGWAGFGGKGWRFGDFVLRTCI